MVMLENSMNPTALKLGEGDTPGAKPPRGTRRPSAPKPGTNSRTPSTKVPLGGDRAVVEMLRHSFVVMLKERRPGIAMEPRTLGSVQPFADPPSRKAASGPRAVATRQVRGESGWVGNSEFQVPPPTPSGVKRHSRSVSGPSP